MNAEKTAEFHQRQSKFNIYFTFKFSDIKKFSQLIQKQIDRLIINNLKFKEHELLL